jgi:hypothetical protein
MPSCFCSPEPPTYTFRGGRVFALRRRGFVCESRKSLVQSSPSLMFLARDLLPLVESQRRVMQGMQNG